MTNNSGKTATFNSAKTATFNSETYRVGYKSGMDGEQLQPQQNVDSNTALASQDAMYISADENKRVDSSIELVREVFCVAVTAISSFTFCGGIAIGLISLFLGFSGAQSVFAWFGAIGFLAFLGSYVSWRCLEKTKITYSAKISLTFFCGIIIALAFLGQGFSWFAIYGQTGSIWIPILAHSVVGLSGASVVLLTQFSKKRKNSQLIERKEEDVNGRIPPTSSI